VSNEIEAGGALATAALAADALQPAAAGPAPHGASCANCGAALAGPFCGQCGQRAHLHRSIGEVVHEVVHGVTHFDGRFWTTLPMLLFRPGQLIRSYVDGQRARHIAPVPLFLMVVFLMFFVLSFAHLPQDAIEVDGNANINASQREAELAKALADIDREIAAAQAGGKADEVTRLKVARAGLVALGNNVRRGTAGSGEALGEVGRELAAANARGAISIDTGIEWLDAKGREALKNPSLMLYKLQTKAYKLSFLLVPLSLPWLWLAFFWRRKGDGEGVPLYDHAIFALYSISFMSLLFIVGSLAMTAGIAARWFWQVMLLLPAAHLFVSLRGAYALGWWGAGWRTLYLSLAAVMNLSAYLLILIVLGVLD